MKRGIELIAEERYRQARKWGDEHDDEHVQREIGLNAVGLALAASDGMAYSELDRLKQIEEWGLNTFGLVEKTISDEGDELRALVIAGALLCSEIDRRQRAGEGVESSPTAEDPEIQKNVDRLGRLLNEVGDTIEWLRNRNVRTSITVGFEGGREQVMLGDCSGEMTLEAYAVQEFKPKFRRVRDLP